MEEICALSMIMESHCTCAWHSAFADGNRVEGLNGMALRHGTGHDLTELPAPIISTVISETAVRLSWVISSPSQTACISLHGNLSFSHKLWNPRRRICAVSSVNTAPSSRKSASQIQYPLRCRFLLSIMLLRIGNVGILSTWKA